MQIINHSSENQTKRDHAESPNTTWPVRIWPLHDNTNQAQEWGQCACLQVALEGLTTFSDHTTWAAWQICEVAYQKTVVRHICSIPKFSRNFSESCLSAQYHQDSSLVAWLTLNLGLRGSNPTAADIIPCIVEHTYNNPNCLNSWDDDNRKYNRLAPH